MSLELSDSQAKIIAISIFNDISKYISLHQEEFEEYKKVGNQKASSKSCLEQVEERLLKKI